MKERSFLPVLVALIVAAGIVVLVISVFTTGPSDAEKDFRGEENDTGAAGNGGAGGSADSGSASTPANGTGADGGSGDGTGSGITNAGDSANGDEEKPVPAKPWPSASSRSTKCVLVAEPMSACTLYAV